MNGEIYSSNNKKTPFAGRWWAEKKKHCIIINATINSRFLSWHTPYHAIVLIHPIIIHNVTNLLLRLLDRRHPLVEMHREFNSLIAQCNTVHVLRIFIYLNVVLGLKESRKLQAKFVSCPAGWWLSLQVLQSMYSAASLEFIHSAPHAISWLREGNTVDGRTGDPNLWSCWSCKLVHQSTLPSATTAAAIGWTNTATFIHICEIIAIATSVINV